jgi:hypothetical protein
VLINQEHPEIHRNVSTERKKESGNPDSITLCTFKTEMANVVSHLSGLKRIKLLEKLVKGKAYTVT